MKFNFNNSYTALPQEFYSNVLPTSVKVPQLVIFNHQLAKQLGIETANTSEDEIAQMLSGNKRPKGAASIAQAYSGHQFGHFTMLGDGRAILLGEQMTPEGDRIDIQFKGAGLTPYSRRGDGRATLSSMLREYLFSESLHALNIPSTRSLAVVSTGETVYREQPHAGGVLTRTANSHIRVGTFQYAHQFGSIEMQIALSKYTINRHFPSLIESETPALDLLNAAMHAQIDLIVNWMRVGFIHGVMNTDNVLLSGESIDYGPCAFMNSYKPSTVFSSIDTQGRYAFSNQPSIALWNITRLAESLLPQIDKDVNVAVEKVKEILGQFSATYGSKFNTMMFHKIGISTPAEADQKLLSRLTSWMEKYKADYTNTFVQLMYPDLRLNKCFDESDVIEWIQDWNTSVRAKDTLPKDIRELMQKNNPLYIPRNKTVENALKQLTENSDKKPFNALLEKVSNPYSKVNIDLDYLNSPEEDYDNDYKTFCGT